MTLSLHASNNVFWQQLYQSRHNLEYTPTQTKGEAAGHQCKERVHGKQGLTDYWLCSIQCFVVRVIAHVVSAIAVQIQEAGIEGGASLPL